MVNLAFPNAISPTDTNNQVDFSELQVQDYDLSLIQANITKYTQNLAALMAQKDTYLLLAQNTNAPQLSTTTTNIPFVLQSTTQDAFNTYDLTSGAFTAPQTAVYDLVVYSSISVISGSVTAIYLNITDSLNGDTSTFSTTPVNGIYYFNFVYPIYLTQGSNLTFYVSTNTATSTLQFSQNSRMFVSWR
jgi:hypothetical protein